DQPSTSKHAEPKPPEWLVRHCEVGSAIAALPGEEKPKPRGQRGAVVARWDAQVQLEECERAIRIICTRELQDRRARRDISEWVELGTEAEDKAQEAERELARHERSRWYRDGMDVLLVALG
ncbi:unnamed protein product, partial [marine sediment metagenome]